MTRPNGRLSFLSLERRIPLPEATTRSALLVLSLLVLFLLREAVFGGRVFYERDLHLQWYGQVESFVRCLTTGSWPLWDPYVSFGQPLLANANNQLFYPPTWLHLLIRPWTYYTLFFAAHLILSGWGVLRLGERLGLSQVGSFVAAALWITSGPFLSLGNAWNHLAAAAWIPWVLLATEAALVSGGTGRILTSGGAWALQIVAGSPDVVAMTALLAAACAAHRWDWRSWVSPANRRALWSGLAAGTVALALSAGQWLPSLELASRSDRWHLSAPERTYWSIHPVGLLQMIVPVLWYEVPLNAQWRSALFEAREPFLFSIYLGVPMLALAALALGRPQVPLRWTLFGSALVGMLFALGRHAPFYAVAVGVLPPLRVLRFPSKGLILTSFCLALLAGAGLDAWRSPVPRRSTFLVGLVCATGFTSALMALLLRIDADTWGPLFLTPPPAGTSYADLLGTVVAKSAWAAGLALLVLGLLLGRVLGARYMTPISAGLVGLLAISDLTWEHRRLNRTAPRDLFTARPEVVSAVDQQDLGRLFVYDYSMSDGRSQRHLKREIPYRVPGLRRDTPAEWASAFAVRMYLLPPVGAAWRLFGSYERDGLGIQPTPLAELNTALVYADGTSLEGRLLRLAAVSQVLALHTAGFEALEPVRTFEGPFFEPIRLFRVPGSLPRTYVVGDARVADGMDALETLAQPGFDIRREILLPSGVPRRAGPGFHGSSRIVELKADSVHIESESNEAGYVVLVDAYDPGWRARVDGRETPLLRANVAFRAIPVPPGKHGIEVAYEPASVRIGVAISAVSLLASSLLFWGVKHHPHLR